MLLVIITLLVSLAPLLGGCSGSDAPMPQAKSGALDLTGWSMEQDGPVRLDGQWEVYWNRLLTPADFQGPHPPVEAAYTYLPSAWNVADSEEAARDKAGVATLRLRVTLAPGTGVERLALRLFNINSAYSLWVNGQPAGQSGVVGTNAEEEREKPSILVAGLPGNSTAPRQPLELLLRVSNFHYRDGGVLAPIWLGPESVLRAQETRSAGIAVFFVGALFIMGVYHVALYFFRPGNISPLYFALYCFLWMGNFATSDTSGWAVRLLLPNLPARLLDQFALSCFFVSVPVGFRFFQSLYPREFSRQVLRFSVALGAVFVALALGLSSMALTSMALPAYYLTSSVLILYCLLRLYRAWRRGREGAAFIFAGFLILGLVGINDMLFDMKLLRSTSLLAPGMLMFILFQAFALSQRLSKAFFAVESLSAQLENKNLSLEAEMVERNRLEREIISISEDERRRMSQDLHDGLCQLLTAARLRCAALAHLKQGLGEAKELEPLSTLLDELVDQAYDLSHGLWPLEHAPTVAGPSLQDMIRRFSRSSGVPIDFRQERACESCLNSNVTQLYRIAQEALANAVKHSKPTHITISLLCRTGDMAMLEVRDNGIGRAKAAVSKGGLGMSIMAHRARMIG
ncbi:MAG: histidine kinase, partial [Desulfovibrionales bacterium GWA2_65_9]